MANATSSIVNGSIMVIPGPANAVVIEMLARTKGYQDKLEGKLKMAENTIAEQDFEIQRLRQKLFTAETRVKMYKELYKEVQKSHTSALKKPAKAAETRVRKENIPPFSLNFKPIQIMGNRKQ